MEPDVKQEQQQAGEDEQQQQQEQVAEATEVRQEVKPERDGALEEVRESKAVGDEELREKLLQMLQESDLSTVTEKMLRKQLEEQLGVKLADKKQLIRQEVMAFLAKQQAPDVEQDGEEGEAAGEEEEEGQEEEEEQEEKPRKRRNNSHLGSVLSEAMQAFVGAQSMPRTQVVKAIWDYIKANNLQDPKDKRSIIPDEKLSTIITPPVTMFSMNKQISRHVLTKDGIVGGGSDDEDGEQPAKKARKSSGSGGASSSRPKPKPKPRAKAQGSSEGGDGAKKELRGFAKPQPISEELAAVTGLPEMSRGTLMKWLFAYIKEKDLYDPSNRRYVISDDALQRLTGESRFLAFGAQKLFGKHFTK